MVLHAPACRPLTTQLGDPRLHHRNPTPHEPPGSHRNPLALNLLSSDRTPMDCREQPSENNCTLTIAGEREEVLNAAVEHAISSHGHTDSEELRSGIESALKPEQTAAAS